MDNGSTGPFDWSFERPLRRHVDDLPIAAILDMLVAVIFFLLLSTTFVNYMSTTLPPARVSTIRDPLVPPPVAPKLVVMRQANKIRLLLSWAGTQPGRWQREVASGTAGELNAETLHAAADLVRALKNQFPSETTIQLGFGRQAVFQDVISTMDGVRRVITDIVLISSEDAEAESRQW